MIVLTSSVRELTSVRVLTSSVKVLTSGDTSTYDMSVGCMSVMDLITGMICEGLVGVGSSLHCDEVAGNVGLSIAVAGAE